MKKNPGRKERRTRNHRERRDPGSIEDHAAYIKSGMGKRGPSEGRSAVNYNQTKDERGNLLPRPKTAYRPGRSRSNRLGLPQYSAGLFR